MQTIYCPHFVTLTAGHDTARLNDPASPQIGRQDPSVPPHSRREPVPPRSRIASPPQRRLQPSHALFGKGNPCRDGLRPNDLDQRSRAPIALYWAPVGHTNNKRPIMVEVMQGLNSMPGTSLHRSADGWRGAGTRFPPNDGFRSGHALRSGGGCRNTSGSRMPPGHPAKSVGLVDGCAAVAGSQDDLPGKSRSKGPRRGIPAPGGEACPAGTGGPVRPPERL